MFEKQGTYRKNQLVSRVGNKVRKVKQEKEGKFS